MEKCSCGCDYPDHFELARLQRENADLRAKLEAAKADTKRLNDLEKYALAKKGSVLWHNSTPKYRCLLTMEHGHFSSLRECLDAMDAQKGGGS